MTNAFAQWRTVVGTVAQSFPSYLDNKKSRKKNGIQGTLRSNSRVSVEDWFIGRRLYPDGKAPTETTNKGISMKLVTKDNYFGEYIYISVSFPSLYLVHDRKDPVPQRSNQELDQSTLL